MSTVGGWQWDLAVTGRFQCRVAGFSPKWQRSRVLDWQPTALLGVGVVGALSREQDRSRLWEDQVTDSTCDSIEWCWLVSPGWTQNEVYFLDVWLKVYAFLKSAHTYLVACVCLRFLHAGNGLMLAKKNASLNKIILLLLLLPFLHWYWASKNRAMTVLSSSCFNDPYSFCNNWSKSAADHLS